MYTLEVNISNYKNFKYVTADTASWDSSLAPDLFWPVIEANILMNKRLGKEVRKLVEHLYDDMLFAKTLLPFGLQTQFQGGMKSGWSCTAPDNSIIHSLLIETFKALYSLEFIYVVYGDDLFIVHELMVFPADLYTQFMASFGLTTRYIH